MERYGLQLETQFITLIMELIGLQFLPILFLLMGHWHIMEIVGSLVHTADIWLIRIMA